MRMKSKDPKFQITRKSDPPQRDRTKSKEKLVRCKIPKYEDWTAPQIAILKPKVFYRYLDRRADRSSKALKQLRVVRNCLHHIKPPVTAPEGSGFWISVDAGFNVVDFNIGLKTETKKYGGWQSYWTSHLCWRLVALSPTKATRHIVTKFCDVFFDGRKDPDVFNNFALVRDNFELQCRKMHTLFANGHEDWLARRFACDRGTERKH